MMNWMELGTATVAIVLAAVFILAAVIAYRSWVELCSPKDRMGIKIDRNGRHRFQPVPQPDVEQVRLWTQLFIAVLTAIITLSSLHYLFLRD
ncbi:hypothetical protein [Nonlabens tegetincola]|nr:hypothetical protein [Nonlabens tegetincola]